MRTVTGPTDRVVVVGAGLGGLSAALRLAAAGREVTVLERADVPGGRAGVLHADGYTFDTGPTVLTMPGLIADALAAVDERLEDWLDLRRLDPAYRAWFPDGSTLDVHADVDAMAAEVSRVCGPAEADGYRRFVAYAAQLYRLEMADFIERNLDSPFDLVTPNLGRLVAMGGFRRLSTVAHRFLADPRTRRVFTFQSMYAGLPPHRALALYAVIAYMDTVAGVYFPVGGMHAVPQGLAGAAAKHGVTFRYGTEVVDVETSGDRAQAVRTADGDRVPCDVLVLNPDLPVARSRLLGHPLRRPVRYSPSCFLLLAGSRARYRRIAHHNVHVGRAWHRTFHEVVDAGRLMSDPSFLVSSATRTDASLAPEGRATYSALFPTPNLRAPLDWTRRRGPYRDEVVGTLERAGYVGFDDAVEVESVTTPLDWQARGMAAGTPFALAHTFGQSGPFRPRNVWGENVVFTGSGTQPGVGVPMVLLSGRLAAERVTGPPRRAGRQR
ncbi:MAG: phytoene desaturase family protein [Actinomycetes bacterium]